MGVLCVLPARLCSKRIPSKPLQRIAGKPLIAYSILQALESGRVTRVIVSTEDAEIAEAD